jgi:metallo-beta-lactamase family protein
MKLRFLGANNTVTGSKYLLNFNGKQILVDCGLFQGAKELRLRNWAKLAVSPNKIDYVLLTHAHIDHSGYVPLLVKNGFNGEVISSEGTQALCNILLPDSGHLHEEEAFRANKYGYSKHHPALPLYTESDAIQALKHFKSTPYGQKIQLGEETLAEWYHAGHIIGASMIRITHNDTDIVFSGDIGRLNDPVMVSPATIQKTDYLVLESTYGDRTHDKADPLAELEAIINKTVNQGGNIIIPAFAVGRTQVLLYYLYQLTKQKRIPSIPIYLDSPMAQNATDLMNKYTSDHRLNSKHCAEICSIAEYITTPEQSKGLNKLAKPKIIISASGMATGGRILHHLRHNLPNPRNTIVFTGFQAEGTRGDRIVGGETEIKIFGEMIPVNAKIEFMQSLSAHADSDEIMMWLGKFHTPPRHVFIVHGEPLAAQALKNRIETELAWSCSIPNYLEQVEL